MFHFDRKSLIFATALLIAVSLIYGSGLDNGLVFDDMRLTDGSIFGQYGQLFAFKVRTLSYGSFVWAQALLGEGWWKQRVINLLMHLATVALLYQFCLQLLQRTEFSDDVREAADFESSKLTALRIGVTLFAVNPAAVYAVAYLVQRSIIMATLFSVAACLAFVLGLQRQRVIWYALSLLCYACAVMSKEYAVGVLVIALPLYVFFRRPSAKQLMMSTVVIGVLFAIGASVLWKLYGYMFGVVIDEVSVAHAAQLEKLVPGIASQVYPLSLLNQAALFFQYGLLWVLPLIGWMSIDIHPDFPLSLLSWPQTLGAVLYLASVVVAIVLVLRRSNVLGLLGLCVLWPGILFMTEFATVWLQDPFVLYRSYLWAAPIPLLIAIPLIFVRGKFTTPVGVLVVCLFAGLAFDRVQSLQTPLTAWSDAATKVDLKAKPNAVGRWRPFQNLGSEQLARDEQQQALRSYAQAVNLSEPLGSAHFSLGMLLQASGQYPQALAEFVKAEGQGFTESSLYFHRGEAQSGLRQFALARKSFDVVIERSQDPDLVLEARRRKAEAALALEDFDAAAQEFQALLQTKPESGRFLSGLSFAYLGQKNYSKALLILDEVIQKKPSPQAYYSRALVHFRRGDKVSSTSDLSIAIQAEPNNSAYLNLQRQLADAATGAKQKK